MISHTSIRVFGKLGSLSFLGEVYLDVREIFTACNINSIFQDCYLNFNNAKIHFSGFWNQNSLSVNYHYVIFQRKKWPKENYYEVFFLFFFKLMHKWTHPLLYAHALFVHCSYAHALFVHCTLFIAVKLNRMLTPTHTRACTYRSACMNAHANGTQTHLHTPTHYHTHAKTQNGWWMQ